MGQLVCRYFAAQVAKQEGEYLADFFVQCDGDAEKLSGDGSRFDYVHKGSLAYIGGAVYNLTRSLKASGFNP
jgi:NADH dehydrogenase FAD-containing subunit